MFSTLKPVDDYIQIDFPTAIDADGAAHALMRLVTGGPETSARMIGTRPIVIWQQQSLPSNGRTLFVSPGALEVLKLLVSSLPSGVFLRAAELPVGRVLLLGDTRNWG